MRSPRCTPSAARTPGKKSWRFCRRAKKTTHYSATSRGEARERVLEAIDALPERERLVILFYYFEEMTMREIGLVLGVVESRVSQIHHETLRRLRSSLSGLRKPVARTLGRCAIA